MAKPVDPVQLILKEAQFAAHKHRDQRRKDVAASPYINHPLSLANILREEGKVEDVIVIAAALLQARDHVSRVGSSAVMKLWRCSSRRNFAQRYAMLTGKPLGLFTAMLYRLATLASPSRVACLPDQ
jgi:hypothetical protein